MDPAIHPAAKIQADAFIGMRGHALRHVCIIHPQSGKPRLAAENHGDRFLRACIAVFVITHRQINFRIAARAVGLAAEIVIEIARIFPNVAMNVDDHKIFLVGKSTFGYAVTNAGSVLFSSESNFRSGKEMTNSQPLRLSPE
jgi:hypothetical protein